MYTLFVILLVITSFCLVAVVLIQSGRGAGLSGAFGMGEGQAVFGSRAGDVLTKATEIFAIAFMILCLLVTWQSKHSQDSLMLSMRTAASNASSSKRTLQTLEETEKMAKKAAETNETALTTDSDTNSSDLAESVSMVAAPDKIDTNSAPAPAKTNK